ncbi:type II toxin-antitoxin system VapC family toxin [Geminicoccaceae bacterium 1502E]|nr:type II toxin-antitoxin system VapC family toxin [Geminicoccaceae bacterium 1502E]
MYLLDMMVLSELRKRQRDANLVAWLGSVPESSLFLSVVTIGEVEKGITGIASRDPAFARRLEAWLDTVLRGFADRILGIDVSTARRWGRLAAAHGHAGADLLIAATALEHGLAVVTRNLRHFADTGAPLLDPFAPSAARS